MKRASYKKDFQSWKGIMALKLLCCNIVAGRFDWKKYCTPQSYCGQEICVVPLHCSYGQRLYRALPLFRYTGSGIRLGNEQINYRQRELGKLFNVSIIQNIASCPSLKNIHQWRASFKNSMLLW